MLTTQRKHPISPRASKGKSCRLAAERRGRSSQSEFIKSIGVGSQGRCRRGRLQGATHALHWYGGRFQGRHHADDSERWEWRGGLYGERSNGPRKRSRVENAN